VEIAKSKGKIRGGDRPEEMTLQNNLFYDRSPMRGKRTVRPRGTLRDRLKLDLEAGEQHGRLERNKDKVAPKAQAWGKGEERRLGGARKSPGKGTRGRVWGRKGKVSGSD